MVRQLQQKLTDALKKQSMLEASLELTSHNHINLDDKIQDLKKEVGQVRSKVHIKFNMLTVHPIAGWIMKCFRIFISGDSFLLYFVIIPVLCFPCFCLLFIYLHLFKLRSQFLLLEAFSDFYDFNCPSHSSTCPVCAEQLNNCILLLFCPER